MLREGDLVNIDVSAELNGVFADCGASYVLGKGDKRLDALCRDGKKAMWAGINAVKAGAPLGDVGNAIGKVAKKGGYTLIRNLASHGVGRALHEEPTEIATWPTRGDRRRC